MKNMQQEQKTEEMSKSQVENQDKPVTPGPKGMFNNNTEN